ncbi:MAG TPA: helix-turn-helix domain-containing protein [Stellaceae bacterium]|jgi:excisionase family DNA binding protein
MADINLTAAEVAAVKVFTLAEAAAVLGVSLRTLQRRIAEAGLDLPKPGRARLLTEADFNRLIEAP